MASDHVTSSWLSNLRATSSLQYTVKRKRWLLINFSIIFPYEISIFNYNIATATFCFISIWQRVKYSSSTNSPTLLHFSLLLSSRIHWGIGLIQLYSFSAKINKIVPQCSVFFPCIALPLLVLSLPREVCK